jgi:uncharacterized membrane protein
MDIKSTLKNRSIELTGISALLLVTALNQISQTPIIYVFTVISLLATIIAVKKFRQQFGTKLLFKRSEGWNYWSGAFGGILAFMMSMYAQTIETGFPTAIAEITAITVFVMLMITLFYGSILSDIQSGELDLENL